ncbi:MAG TPA: hypothetical protein VEI49_02620 [Terriglobales bacterium]|nr:hypothetical protein [Terriglobales bacterium]
MIFARIAFWLAGAFGILALVPLYRAPGNAMYYGLLATLVAWQVAFFIIGWRPRQLRPLMIPAVLEKALWMATLLALLARGQVTGTQVLLNAATHGLLGVLFIVAFFTSRPLPASQTP